MKLTFHKNRPYFSTLTGRYYPDYDEAFQDSLRAGGGAYVDFNLYYLNPQENIETVF